MNKTVVFWMLFIAFNSMACDICNMSVSLTPDDTKNRISLLYRHRFASKTFTQLSYKPVEVSEGIRHSGVILIPEMKNQIHTEIYSVMDIRGVYNFTNRLRIIGSLPFIKNERKINEEREKLGALQQEIMELEQTVQQKLYEFQQEQEQEYVMLKAQEMEKYYLKVQRFCQS